MSGSSGGFSFSSSSTPKECGTLQLKIHLASPVADVLDLLSPGDILLLSLRNPTGPVIASTLGGELAGAILTNDPGFLIACITQGYIYHARVLSLAGGDCQVSIYCTNP